MGEIFLLSLTAALNPTLLAATTLMLVLPSPKRLLLGYLCGALMTSITIGCVLVFTVGARLERDAQRTSVTINPIWDITLGALILIVCFVVGDRARPVPASRARAQEGGQGRQEAAEVASRR